MKYPPSFPSLKNDYDTFLFASLGEEKNGMPLSMLSALARQGLDPWDEAAQLNRMPRANAAQRLTSLIAECPNGRPTLQSDPVFSGLVALLPRHALSLNTSGNAAVKTHPNQNMRGFLYIVLFNLLFAGFVLGSEWAITRFHPIPGYPSASSSLEPPLRPAPVAGQ